MFIMLRKALVLAVAVLLLGFTPSAFAQTAGPAAHIYGVYHNGVRAMQPGDILTAEVDGTAGATATFDLLGVSNGNPMRETSPGHYLGTVTISAQMAGQSTTVVAHLVQNGLTIARQSATNFSIAVTPSVTATLTSVRIYSRGPVQVGQTVSVIAHGTPGGSATMDVGAQTGIPLTETRPGRYRAQYAVTAADVLNRPVLVTLRLSNGTVTTLASAQSLARSYPGNYGGNDAAAHNPGALYVTLDSPHEGDYTNSDFTATGTTEPFATVTFNATTRNDLNSGGIDVDTRTVNLQVQADEYGNYSIPVHLHFEHNHANVVLDVTARDQYGNTSHPVQIYIVTGP